MTPTRARDHAAKLAKTDPEAALHATRQIADPWFGCQALAWVARFAPDHLVETVASEALTVGRRSDDPYKVVGASAWPVRALVERGHLARLRAILQNLFVASDKIENPPSCSEALLLLFQAVFPAGREFWQPILPKLVKLYAPDTFWRQGRNVHDALLVAATVDEELSRKLCSQLPVGRWRNQFERGLDRREHHAPREFFW